jgi:hypothetical protein
VASLIGDGLRRGTVPGGDGPVETEPPRRSAPRAGPLRLAPGLGPVHNDNGPAAPGIERQGPKEGRQRRKPSPDNVTGLGS